MHMYVCIFMYVFTFFWEVPLAQTSGVVPQPTTLEATQGQIHGFFSQHPYKCHQKRVGD